MSANQLWLDLRSDEGRVQVGIDVCFLSSAERKWLFAILEGAREGHKIEFGASEQNGGAELHFTITEAQTPHMAHQENAAIQ